MSSTQGNGITLALATSAFTSNKMTISQDGETRDDVDTSHLGSTDTKSYEPAELAEGGTYTIEGQFDPEKIGDVPSKGVVEIGTFTLPISNPANTTPGTVACNMYVNSFSWSAGINELMPFTLVFKVAGPITRVNETV